MSGHIPRRSGQAGHIEWTMTGNKPATPSRYLPRKKRYIGKDLSVK